MQQETGHTDVIEIKMFGGFRIAVGEHSIQDSSMRTHQLWHLIEYLIAFRNKTISQDEIIGALWPEGEIDNPSNALKNLVYRIRTTFTGHGIPFAKEMIIYHRGSYQWNNALNVQVDTEQFEKYYKAALDEELGDDGRIDIYLKAIDLYEGNFLPASCYESWVIPIASYYHLIYFKCVYAVLELLERQERFEEIEVICSRAQMIDQFEESIHRYYMRALISQGKQQQALAHYSFVTDLFFRELGVSPSAEMRELYREIVKTVHDVVIDLGVIQEDLKEPGELGGAFYCEYEVFKNLYRLEARTAARTGQSIFISLLTIEPDIPGRSLDIRQQSKIMDSLYDIIQSSLRRGDVYARFSAAQYVLMLPTLTYENCEMVMGRIIKRYRQAYRPKGISIHAKIHPLDPIEMG
jgi:DNA-binding SARP family transcriptional activator